MSKSLAANRDLSFLHPVVRSKVQAIHSKLKQEKIPFEVYEAYRTPHRQDHLYAQGRTRSGRKVTWVKAWDSIHQYGLAVDFVLKINGQWSWDDKGAEAAFWTRMHALAKEHGMTPLFDRRGRLIEKPHIQLIDVKASDLRAGHYPEGGDASWAENLSTNIDEWTGHAPPKPAIAPELPAIDATILADLEASEPQPQDTISGFSTDMTFQKLHAFIRNAEGGFADEPADPGGPTQFGVTQATLSDWRGKDVSKEEVKALSREEADEILYTNYYLACRCDEMPERTAMVVYNSAVMSGTDRAIRILQQAFNAMGMLVRDGANPEDPGQPLVVDGIYGSNTRAAVTATDATELSKTYLDIYEDYLRKLPQFSEFEKGWMKRLGRLRGFINQLPEGAGKKPEKVTKVTDRKLDIDLDDVLPILMAGATGGKSALAAAAINRVLRGRAEDDDEQRIGKQVLRALVRKKLDLPDSPAPASTPDAPQKALTPVNAAFGENIGHLLNGRKSVIGVVGLIAAAVVPELGLTSQNAPELTALLDGDNQTIVFTLLSLFTGWGFLGKIDKAIRAARQ